MKKLIIISILSVIGLLFIAAAPVSLEFENTLKSNFKNKVLFQLPDKNYQKEFNVKFGGKLNVDLKTGGSISIEGWNKEVVSAEVSVKGRDAEQLIVDLVQSGNDVDILAEVEDMHENYKINTKVIVKVPNKYNVYFSTMGGGVKILSVNGDMDGKTMGGGLELNNLKGKIDFTTMGGEINIKDCDVDGKLLTMGGNINMENVKGDLDAKTMGGKIKQINVSSSSDGKEVSISTMGGSVNVDEAKNGAKVKTMGGEITVNKAEKFVDAETMGGDIQIKSVDGWVRAKTMGGDIEVNIVGDPNKGEKHVSLSSLSGDVTLTVPSGLSMDVDVEITFTKKYDGDVKIVSDFQLEEEVSKEWKRTKGDARKKLTGKAQINGGKNKIRISTINGNVYLKKS